MKNNIKFWGIFTLAAVIGFSIAACNGGSSDPALTGNLTISPSAGIAPVTLTAIYDGPEAVTYQWRRGSTSLGTSATQLADAAGTYMVTVSAPGFSNKRASASIAATGGDTTDGIVGTWIADMTRRQLAEASLEEFAELGITTVEEAELFLMSIGAPVSFPALRIVFTGTQDSGTFILYSNEELKGPETWVESERGTYTVSGNVLTMISGDESEDFYINNNRFDVSEGGITLTMVKQ